MSKEKRIKNSPARSIALVGMMAATVECAKLILSALPNIEVVTILIAIYSYSFGALGVIASFVFVFIEPLIYGFGTWTITYIIYWPSLAVLFMIIGKMKIKNRVVITSAALTMTIWFGVLSTLVDIGLLSGFFDNFFYRFGVYYLRGIPFYIAQLAINAVLFPLLFRYITDRLEKYNLNRLHQQKRRNS